MKMAFLEVDTATWLKNKLGNEDDQWSSGGIASLYTKDVLKSIYDIFLELDSKIKTRVLLSFLEIPQRNMDTLKDMISEVIGLADCDADDWVRVSASIVKDYPYNGTIDVDLSPLDDSFHQTLQDIVAEGMVFLILKKMVFQIGMSESRMIYMI